MLFKSTGVRLFRHLAVGAALLAIGTLGAAAQEWRTTDTMGEHPNTASNFQHYDHVNAERAERRHSEYRRVGHL